jgi:hypothetical protein
VPSVLGRKKNEKNMLLKTKNFEVLKFVDEHKKQLTAIPVVPFSPLGPCIKGQFCNTLLYETLSILKFTRLEMQSEACDKKRRQG